MTEPRKTLRALGDLRAAGILAADADPRLDAVAARYAIAVTPEMATLVDPYDPGDPIRRQFVPDARELVEAPGERADPIGDHVHEKVPGLVHRYPDRVLLKVTHACPVYCRFCFRREMVGPGGPPPMSGDLLARAAGYIADQPQVFEAILTGGDPFVLAPRRIAEITGALAAIPNLKVLRWHTRVPVVDPDRITAELIAALSAAPKIAVIGIHANHPRELTSSAQAAIARLRSAGLMLMSQTVLLKGINDDAATLADLFRALLVQGVRPYYLHHADLAPGTSHFRMSIAEGQALMRDLRGRLSGLALPTYVLDIPDGHGKVPIGPVYHDPATGSVIAPDGQTRAYPPTSSGQ